MISQSVFVTSSLHLLEKNVDVAVASLMGAAVRFALAYATSSSHFSLKEAILRLFLPPVFTIFCVGS